MSEEEPTLEELDARVSTLEEKERRHDGEIAAVRRVAKSAEDDASAAKRIATDARDSSADDMAAAIKHLAKIESRFTAQDTELAKQTKALEGLVSAEAARAKREELDRHAATTRAEDAAKAEKRLERLLKVWLPLGAAAVGIVAWLLFKVAPILLRIVH